MAQTKIKLIADGVIDVNNLAAGHTITTDNIGEGSNLYYTDARVASYLATGGNIGIGTSSADQLLHVEKSNAGSGVELLVVNSGANQSGTYSQIGVGTGGDATGTSYLRLYRDGSGISEFKGYNIQTFLVGGAERMRIDSSGNIGIGTSSPNQKLSVASTNGNTSLAVVNSTPSTAGTETNYISYYGTSNGGALFTTALAQIGAVSVNGGTPIGKLVFKTTPAFGSPTDRLTIDQDGNVGIGYTAVSGLKTFVYDNQTTTAFAVQQDNSSGIIALFNSSAGSNRLRIDNDGLKFFGNSAAANALDDYEEGTWTPSLECNGQVGSFTYTLQYGRYTKIGRVVYCNVRIDWSAKPSIGSTFRLSGLPFSYDNDRAGFIFGSNAGFPTGAQLNGILTTTGGLSPTAFRFTTVNGNVNVTTGNNIASSGNLIGTFFYIV